ncbi:MAG: hypothetical protein ACUVV0_08725, partial [Anaerolineae bacterium]
MKIRERIANYLFGDVIEARVRHAVKVVDDKWWDQISGAARPQDKPWHEFKSDLDDALEAWRTNPLARRIVQLTTDYVVGDGITIGSEIEEVADFIRRFWGHRKNRMALRLYSMCDELTRSGELFPVLSTNPADGMSYIRFVPACRINEIETDPDDLERELSYRELVAWGLSPRESIEGRRWPSPEAFKNGQAAPGNQAVMLHYAINRPVGCVRGESDLVPILPWLRRYKEWLEDRVRVNRHKNAFLWMVTLRNATPGDIRKKQLQYSHPPSPGSVIVADENESWTPISPHIQAEQAQADGKALRLIIAAGAGIPLHFLSEGESATRATAAEMGDPTFRHFYHRQLFFVEMLKDIIATAYGRAVALGKARPYDDLKLTSTLTDLTTEDNRELAQAAREIVEALSLMKSQGWIDDETAIRIAFKFAGEIVDPQAILESL